MKNEYFIKKGERALATARLFCELKGNVSDIELAEILNKRGIETSSSTVGRDLTVNLSEYYTYMNESKYGFSGLKEEEEVIVRFIKNKRAQNKLDGKRKGGKNSVKNNEIIRDSNNHFKGSRPRG